MRTALNLIRIVRPHNVAAAVLSTMVGFAMAGPRQWPGMLILAVALCTAAGYAINDLSDVAIDRINKPRRVLPSGAASPRSVRALYAVLLLALAATVLRLPPIQAAWIISWAVLLHLYSVYLKRIYLVGNMLVSAVSASGFLLGAFAAGSLRTGILPACFTFAFMLGRELVKDCEDETGDRLCGARTVPVVSGKGIALHAAAGIFIALALAFPLPGLLGFYRSGYTMIMFASVVPILVVSIILVLRGASLALVSLILKAGMFFGISAFYFGGA